MASDGMILPPGSGKTVHCRGLDVVFKEGPPDTEAIAELRRKYDTEQVAPLVTGS
jgi:hypothetical protein